VIEEIRIRSLGVIEESGLELGPGFTAITGETGAGKTMVVSALRLLLGARADSGAVRAGASSARVEGIVRTGAWSQALEPRLDELGAEVDDGALVIARQVAAEGRSRATVGGAAVPVGALSEISQALVVVHGQADQHRLQSAAEQLDALDRYAGADVLALRSRFAEAYEELRAVRRELDELVAAGRERAREADLLRFGLDEIAAVDPQPGEDSALADEEERLAHADALRTAAESARLLLSNDEEDPDALGSLAAARATLEGVRAHDPEAAALSDRLAEASYLVSDLAADAASYAAGLESDPTRLQEVVERRAALKALMRKYGEDLEAVLAWASDASAALARVDNADQLVADLEERQRLLRADLAELGADLSAGRADAAQRLADEVTLELVALAMPHARVTIAVRQVPDPSGIETEGGPVRAGVRGLDEVEFLLAANPGTEPRSLAKTASGGELSRLMLALEVVLAASDPVPTLVFDEIDAGIGGKAAVEVGRRLARLAGAAQVVVVTHLPQVAAFAHTHVRVSKSSTGSVTTSDLAVLGDDERVVELSRMLAGLEDSASARAHAQELLETARAGGAR
jgi:DNA repair protein RecN (Recombination protein N)